MAQNLSPAELQELIKLFKILDGLSDSAAQHAATQAQNIGNATNELDRLRKAYKDFTGDISNALKTFKELVSQISKQKTGIEESKKAYKGLSSIAEKIQYHQMGISTLSSKEIKNLQEKAKQEKQRLETAQYLLDSDKAKIESDKRQLIAAIQQRAQQGLLSNDLRKQLAEKNLKLQEINKTYQENKDLLNDTNNSLTQTVETLETEYKAAKKIEKSMGLTGALMKGISKIPILGDMPGMASIAGEVEEEMKKIEREEGRIVGRTEAMGMAFKKVGGVIKDNLTDPLFLIGLLVKGFKAFLDIGFAASKQTTEMGKSMAISSKEAGFIRERFRDIQNSSDNILVTTVNLAEAQGQLANAFGATRGFTDAQLQDQIKLTKAMGLTEETAAGIQQLAMANGKSADDVVASTIKQTAALAKQKGIQLDNRKVLAEVAKVSGQLRLQYQNNPELIAKAVVQTQKLGINLEQAKNMAEKLLDFEQSISSELEAELLTGKDLNLEEARLLAFQGKSAEAAALMLKQMGGSAEFAKMNVFQQQSIAQALGMNADELANSLVAQENLNRLGGETKKQIEEQLKLAKANGETDKIRMLENSLGNEKEAKAALEKLDAQTQFNAAIDKLKSMLTSIVEGPALKFVEMLANTISNGEALKSIFTQIGIIISTISLTKLITGLITAAVSAGSLSIASATFASALTLGIGAAVIIGSIAAISSAMSNAQKDAENRAKQLKPAKAARGGTVVGKGSVMVGEEGPEILSLNPGATITPLSKTNAATEVYSTTNNSSGIDYDRLINGLADAISGRPTYLDSQKVNQQSNLSAVSVQ